MRSGEVGGGEMNSSFYCRCKVNFINSAFEVVSGEGGRGQITQIAAAAAAAASGVMKLLGPASGPIKQVHDSK